MPLAEEKNLLISYLTNDKVKLLMNFAYSEIKIESIKIIRVDKFWIQKFLSDTISIKLARKRRDFNTTVSSCYDILDHYFTNTSDFKFSRY